MLIKYTFYKTIYYSKGEQIYIETNGIGKYGHITEMFSIEHPELYSWNATSEANYHTLMNITIPETGFYIVKIRSDRNADTGLCDIDINGKYLYDKGRIWIASDSKHLNSESTGGLTCFDGKKWKTYTKENSGLPSNVITSIATDASGNIWLGTYGNVGVTMFDGNDRWEIFNTSNSGIADNDISGISIDQLQNTIWLNGFRSRGISVAQIDGNTTGISSAKTKTYNTNIYDLSGLKVTNPEKGNVYISNGRKFIKK